MSKIHQPYWPNISARSLAKEIKCHSRTIVRTAKKLGIPMGIPLSDEDKTRIALKLSEGRGIVILGGLPKRVATRFTVETLKSLQSYIETEYGAARRMRSIVIEQAVKEYLAREEKRR